MLFNSLEFAVFFPIVTFLFYALPQNLRWAMLLAASCLFYAAFVPVYILILLVTILIDYFAGIYIVRTEGKKKKALLIVSILSTCLVLFVFKYFNFFNANAEAIARAIGWNYPIGALQLILPIGLSFHTFQSLSYVVEVYRGNQKPEHHFGIYALYVMFYPQLVAGPIERPQNLLHQFREPHPFNYAQFTSGLRLMAWGLFKKMVIADRLAPYVNGVYAAPENFSGAVLVLATIAFAYQIYCDFSGYSDIAIGAARTMGFHLMTNFRSPYYSQSIAEFWKRWHISLSTWFRDYVYIPLGGSRVSTKRWTVNILVVFALSGLWHGANWTYVAWGLLNGTYILAEAGWAAFRERFLGHSRPSHQPLMAAGRILLTFCLTCIAWVFFRANDLSDALYVITHFFSASSTPFLQVPGANVYSLGIAAIGIVVLEGVQAYEQRGRPMEARLIALPLGVRWAVYYAFLFVILLLGAYDERQFIYFQF